MSRQPVGSGWVLASSPSAASDGWLKAPELNTPANLVVICGSGTTGCHGRVESQRSEAYADGLLLHDGQDPAAVPVLLACPVDGWPRLVLLTVDGGYADPVVD